MRKLLLLGAVVVLLVAADVAARHATEAQLRERLARAVPSGRAVSAQIRSFPFLGQLAVSGNVSTVIVGIRDVQVERVHFDSLVVRLHDVHIDRNHLVNERKVELTSIGRGTAVGEMTEGDVVKLVGVPVVLQPGRVIATVRGVRVPVDVSVRDNVVRLRAAGVSLPAFTLPKVPLLPCVTNAEVLAARLRLSCAVDQPPPELLRLPPQRIRA